VKKLLVLALIAGCAGARSKSESPPQAPAVMGPDPHAEITALEQDIIAAGGVFAPVSVTMDVQAMSTFPRSTDASCHPAATQTCTDSCKLSDTICVDAAKICDIAGKLPTDTWAAGKCDSGKASCGDANKSCCACTN
jgi:hypothetical protein